MLGLKLNHVSKRGHKGPIEHKSALFQVMAWHQAGNKPSHEPMMTQFTDAYMWH